MRVVTLVPRRADGGRRDAIWDWVRGRWVATHPEVEVFEGHHDDGPFNRSAAVNAAADLAGDFDVAIVADSDSFVPAEQINQAVAIASSTCQITFAYTRFAYLNRRMSNKVMSGFCGDWWPGVEWTLAGTCSSMVVVPRALWDEVGGFDDGFTGWGFEDVAFSVACQAIGGGMNRTAGEVWHLHHQTQPTSSQKSPTWQPNLDRMKRYEQCDFNGDKVRSLLAELRS